MADVDHLACTICLEPPPGQVFQCHHGHLLCADCTQSLADRRTKACPTCRVPLAFPPIRSVAVEEELARRPASCRHCGLELTKGQLQQHEAQCPSRKVDCPGEECDWVGSPQELIEHSRSCVHAIVLRAVSRRCEPLQAELEALRAEQRYWADERRELNELRAEVAALRSQRAASAALESQLPPDLQAFDLNTRQRAVMEAIHVSSVGSAIGISFQTLFLARFPDLPPQQLRSDIGYLLEEGLVYSTIDDEHYRATHVDLADNASDVEEIDDGPASGRYWDDTHDLRDVEDIN